VQKLVAGLNICLARGFVITCTRKVQSVIQQIQTALGGNVGLFMGLVFLGLLTLYLATLCYGTLRRLSFERVQRSLARYQLREEIKAARLRCQEVEQIKLLWNGCRKFQVVKKIRECHEVDSFYLAPHDGRALPVFKPGQYITFQLNVPGEGKPVIRCYSLSDSPFHQDYYRITIKKLSSPQDQPDIKPGRASCYFCDRVQVGDILDLKAPGGHFFLDMSEERPVVLISGGVGITPMLSMINAIIESRSKREVWFFHGARHGAEHIQKQHLEKLAAENENVRLHICYSRPSPEDVLGRDYQHTGHVTADLLKQMLPSSNYDYFICGPGPMMKGITDGLAAWGVPDKNVHFEAFGPATVKKATAPPTASETAMLSKFQVTFSRAAKTWHWNPATASLLEFAEEHGIKIEAGCRAGNCGTCLVAVKSGEVEYLAEPGANAEGGSCLTCICKPKSNLVLDA
jgi:ferredoxin-NADP reductase